MDEGSFPLRKFDTNVVSGGADPDRLAGEQVRTPENPQVVAGGEGVVALLPGHHRGLILQQQDRHGTFLVAPVLDHRPSRFQFGLCRQCRRFRPSGFREGLADLLFRANEHEVRHVAGTGWLSSYSSERLSVHQTGKTGFIRKRCQGGLQAFHRARPVQRVRQPDIQLHTRFVVDIGVHVLNIQSLFGLLQDTGQTGQLRTATQSAKAFIESSSVGLASVNTLNHALVVDGLTGVFERRQRSLHGDRDLAVSDTGKTEFENGLHAPLGRSCQLYHSGDGQSGRHHDFAVHQHRCNQGGFEWLDRGHFAGDLVVQAKGQFRTCRDRSRKKRQSQKRRQEGQSHLPCNSVMGPVLSSIRREIPFRFNQTSSGTSNRIPTMRSVFWCPARASRILRGGLNFSPILG